MKRADDIPPHDDREECERCGRWVGEGDIDTVELLPGTQEEPPEEARWCSDCESKHLRRSFG